MAYPKVFTRNKNKIRSFDKAHDKDAAKKPEGLK